MTDINRAPRPLDMAVRRGGLFYTTDGTPVDANGNVLEGAPERPKNTEPHEQPYAKMVAAQSIGAAGAPAAFDAEALGRGIAAGLAQAASRAEANTEGTQTANAAAADLAKGAGDAKIKADTPPVGDASRGSAQPPNAGDTAATPVVVNK